MKRFFNELEDVGFLRMTDCDGSVSYRKRVDNFAVDIEIVDKFHLAFTFQYKSSGCIYDYSKKVPTNVIRCWCHNKLTLEDMFERVENGNVGKILINMLLSKKMI